MVSILARIGEAYLDKEPRQIDDIVVTLGCLCPLVRRFCPHVQVILGQSLEVSGYDSSHLHSRRCCGQGTGSASNFAVSLL